METTQKEKISIEDYEKKSKIEKILKLKSKLENSRKEIQKNKLFDSITSCCCHIFFCGILIQLAIYFCSGLLRDNFIIVCENRRCYILPQTENGLNDYGFNYSLENACVYNSTFFLNKHCLNLFENELDKQHEIEIEIQKENKKIMEILWEEYIYTLTQSYNEVIQFIKEKPSIIKMIKNERVDKKKECYTNTDCHRLEKCTEDYKCVIDNLKKPPERVFDKKEGWKNILNDGECMSNRDCAGNKLSKNGDKFLCNEHYECVPISSSKK